jgi:hypothetical protein
VGQPSFSSNFGTAAENTPLLNIIESLMPCFVLIGISGTTGFLLQIVGFLLVPGGISARMVFQWKRSLYRKFHGTILRLTGAEKRE